ncbi:hypothetical protein C8R46DRAFT_1293620 [Mycena filopes]|nr:hypothetical protein C8R46DRAFT_1293620 [Mycena filopes]
MKILLPPELQREIFETAIRTNHGDIGDAELKLNLSLVAHHVHLWVDSVFYRAVTIRHSPDAIRFLTLADSKPADFLAKTVKVLILGPVRPKDATRLLHACRGVESLAFHWKKYYNAPLPVDQLPLLRRLWLRCDNVGRAYYGNELRPSIYLTTLTHLDLAYTRHLQDMPDLAAILKRLPGLTHVSNPPWPKGIRKSEIYTRPRNFFFRGLADPPPPPLP